MNIEEQARLVFLAALEQPSEQWNTHLERACSDNAQLRARVKQLLAGHQELGSIHAGDGEFPPTLEQPRLERPGMQIGPYKLMEEIGEGGMGLVFVAEQHEPVRRKVALKVIKPGMDTRDCLARFEAERQALALMDHPNIARVLDAGATESGRPYFVMELVKGAPITEYCDANRLAPRDRLKLFIDVCRAVQHAHQKGIIHRDIKPTNVLVASHDGTPVVKVIDFGVAKAIGQQLTTRTIYTAMTQMVGTPLYMSPEQAGMSSLDIDTRTDIYSLGVLLYELLTGTTPFDKDRLQKAAYDEMRRIIREEEPQKPSTRISTTQGAPGIAAQRNMEHAKLTRLVRGELDWIVMKALEKDRNRRYDTPNGLARDVERYLADEPVQACPPSTVYRLRKLARRHKAALALVSSVAGLLLLAVAALAVGNVLIKQERDEKARALVEKGKALEQESTALNKAQRQETLAKEQAEEARRQQKIAIDQELLARRRLYAAQMNLAMQAWSAREPARVLELLETQRPRFDEADLRGFEWYHLWHQCHRGCKTFVQVDGAANALAFAPDNQTLAVGCHDGTVLLWHAPSGKSRRLVPPQEVVHSNLVRPIHAQYHTRLAFSPNGKTLVASNGPRLAFWDWQAGTELGEAVHPQFILSMAFFPDGRKLATGLTNDFVTIWDADSRAIEATFKLSFGPEKTANRTGIRRLAVAPDGETIALGRGWNVIVGQWRDSQWHELRRHTDLTHYVQSLAFSPDGKSLAAACLDHGRDRGDLKQHVPEEIDRAEAESAAVASLEKDIAAPLAAPATAPAEQPKPSSVMRGVRVWDMETGQDRVLLQGRGATGWLSSVAFSPDGKSLAVGNDHSALFFDLTNGAPMAPIHATPIHRQAIQRLAFSADGKWLATGSRDGVVKVWDRETQRLPTALFCDGGTTVVALAGDGRTLLAGKSKLRQWDIATGEERASRGLENHPQLNAISPDCRWLATRGPAGIVSVWDAASGQPIFQLPKYESKIFETAFSPDGRTLAVAAEETLVKLWDIPGQRLRAALPNPAQSYHVAYSPDGRLVAAGDWIGEVRVFDAAAARQLAIFKTGSTWVMSLAFSSDSTLLATGNRDGSLSVWNLSSLQLEVKLPGQAEAVTSVAFFPNGRTLVSGTEEDSVKLWDLATGQERITFKGRHSQVTSLAISRDGSLMVAGNIDGNLRLYRSARTPEAIATRSELTDEDESGPLRRIENARQLWATGRLDAAAEAYGEAKERLLKLAALFPEEEGYQRHLAGAWFELGVLETVAGRSKEAELACRGFRECLGTLTSRQKWSLARTGPDLKKVLVAAQRAADADTVDALDLELGLDSPVALNNVAWRLATAPNTADRNSERSVALAKRAVELLSRVPAYHNTLGVAYYRAGNYQDAVTSLQRSAQLQRGYRAEDLLFLAMAHWQLDHKPLAQKMFTEAIKLIKANANPNEELQRFAAEAEALGLKIE